MGKKSQKWLRKVASRVPRRGLVAEIGVWKGRSTLCMASRLPKRARILAIDSWEGVPEDPQQHDVLYAANGVETAYQEFRKNLRKYIKAGVVVPLRMDSAEGAKWIARNEGLRVLDFAFIDGDHRYEAVSGDIRAYLPLMKPGAILAGHDRHWPGVISAVEELLPEWREGPGSIWYWRVPG